MVALGMFQVERFTAKAWSGCRRCDNGSVRGSLGITALVAGCLDHGES